MSSSAPTWANFRRSPRFCTARYWRARTCPYPASATGNRSLWRRSTAPSRRCARNSSSGGASARAFCSNRPAGHGGRAGDEEALQEASNCLSRNDAAALARLFARFEREKWSQGELYRLFLHGDQRRYATAPPSAYCPRAAPAGGVGRLHQFGAVDGRVAQRPCPLFP